MDATDCGAESVSALAHDERSGALNLSLRWHRGWPRQRGPDVDDQTRV